MGRAVESDTTGARGDEIKTTLGEREAMKIFRIRQGEGIKPVMETPRLDAYLNRDGFTNEPTLTFSGGAEAGVEYTVILRWAEISEALEELGNEPSIKNALSVIGSAMKQHKLR